MQRYQKLINMSLWSVMAMGLAACGGGSAQTPVSPVVEQPTAPPPTTPAPPSTPSSNPETYRTTEYATNYGLEAIHAAEAYAKGYSGEGVIIGLVDFNFNLASAEVNFSSASRTGQQRYRTLYEEQFGEPASTSPHGQAVAVVAAGVRNDSGTHGVAYNATVIGVDFFSGVNLTDVRQNGILYHVSNPWTYLVQHGARVINKSLGYDEDSPGTENGSDPDEWYVLEYDTAAVQAGALLVSSAGNNGDPEPSLSNLDSLDRLRGLGLLNSGPGAMIIVGAVDENNVIADFSDRAGGGESRFHYLVAPGVDIVAPYTTDASGPGLYYLSGTSFSAPHVTGAAALIFEKWPSLTAREVADILFESATDLGAPGVDAVYGHGLLNVSAALEPIGAQAIPTKTGAASVSGMAITMGPAFGDAVGLGAALSNTMMLDKFGRDFRVDLSGFVSGANPRLNLEDRLDQRQNWRASSLALGTNERMGYVISVDRDSVPDFALTGQAAQDFQPEVSASFELSGRYNKAEWAIGTGRSLTDALSRQPVDSRVTGIFSITGANDTVLPAGRGAYMVTGRPVGKDSELWFGASLGQHDGNDFAGIDALKEDSRTVSIAARLENYRTWGRFGAELGVLEENDAILGSRSAGGLALTGGATSVWFSLDGETDLGQGFLLEASVTGTATEAGGKSGSLFDGSGTLMGSSFKAYVSKTDAFHDGDNVRFGVYQPLRMERAYTTLSDGAALDPTTGDVLFQSRQVSLAPSGREIAVEAAYRLSVNGWLMEANIGHRFDAGHIDGLEDTLMMLGFTRRF